MQRSLSAKIMRTAVFCCTWWRQRSGSVRTIFSTVFSQETGQTFVEYLTAVRIEAAKHLLTNGNSRMSDIAFDVGYQDSHYFSYLFKKHVGVSPREYRSRSEEG